MRDLYEEILDFYLLNEALSKEPSSPIVDDGTGQHKETKLVRYFIDSSKDENISTDNYSGTHHHIGWNPHKTKEEMSNTERKNSLHDTLHIHNHFIKHDAQEGDIVSNKPTKDEDGGGGNKRARIYAKKAGFGEQHDNEFQYGIVIKHPDDHPEEHKRGQKELIPLNQNQLYRKK